MGAKITFMTVGAIFVHFPETMRSAKVENSCGGVSEMPCDDLYCRQLGRRWVLIVGRLIGEVGLIFEKVVGMFRELIFSLPDQRHKML